MSYNLQLFLQLLDENLCLISLHNWKFFHNFLCQFKNKVMMQLITPSSQPRMFVGEIASKLEDLLGMLMRNTSDAGVSKESYEVEERTILEFRRINGVNFLLPIQIPNP
jgi:hypothetical protein